MSLKTITTAEPSIAPPPMVKPMVKHLIERKRDPEQKHGGPFHPDQYEDKALCGYVWDRLLDLKPTGPTCEDCKAEARRRGGSA